MKQLIAGAAQRAQAAIAHSTEGSGWTSTRGMGVSNAKYANASTLSK